MSGTDFRISLADVRQAHREHLAGWSLRAIARRNWRHWDYASPKSALEGLRCAMRTLELPIRDRIEATVLASTTHGHSRRAARAPDHPDHDLYLAHRRYLRARALRP